MLIVDQDGERISENLEICIAPVYADCPDDILDCWCIENDYVELGRYKTKERAKEVLKQIVRHYWVEDEKRPFYMPKE